MKKLFTLFIIIILAGNLGFAQVIPGFFYMGVARDINEQPVKEKTISLRISIFKGPETGMLEFSEIHTPTTDKQGVIAVQVGTGSLESGNFTAINWGADVYFIKTEIDTDAGSNFTLAEVRQLFSVPYATYADKAENVFSGSWDDLDGIPANLMQDISLTDFDLSISDKNSVNLADFSKWTTDGVNRLYTDGKVGIAASSGFDDFDGALKVGGAIKFSTQTSPSIASPGLLFYKSDGGFGSTGGFAYYDNTGTEQALTSSFSSYSGQWTQSNGNYVASDKEVLFKDKLAVGYNTESGMDFGDNTVVFKDDNIVFYFLDTSTSASFPTNDWKLKFNDDISGKDNIAITDIDGGKTPFTIEAGAPENAIFISETGDVGIGTDMPASKLDIKGDFRADYLSGSAKMLTNLPVAVTSASISNLGSTSIQADTDADTNGEIIFKIKDDTKMTIANNGNVGIGTNMPSVTLEVNGDVSADILHATESLTTNMLTGTINYDNTSGGFISPYDVTGKSKIIANPISITQWLLGAGIDGQELSIVNTSTNDITIYTNPVVTLKQYESVSYIYTLNTWMISSTYKQ